MAETNAGPAPDPQERLRLKAEQFLTDWKFYQGQFAMRSEIAELMAHFAIGIEADLTALRAERETQAKELFMMDLHWKQESEQDVRLIASLKAELAEARARHDRLYDVLEIFSDLNNWTSAQGPFSDSIDGWIGDKEPWSFARKALSGEARARLAVPAWQAEQPDLADLRARVGELNTAASDAQPYSAWDEAKWRVFNAAVRFIKNSPLPPPPAVECE